MSKPLTPRQQEVMDYVKQFFTENGICPSTRQIQHQFGFASQTAAASHLKCLLKKGHLRKCPHSGRIILNEQMIPWADVAPLLKVLQFFQRDTYAEQQFFAKYPHLRP